MKKFFSAIGSAFISAGKRALALLVFGIEIGVVGFVAFCFFAVLYSFVRG